MTHYTHTRNAYVHPRAEWPGNVLQHEYGCAMERSMQAFWGIAAERANAKHLQPAKPRPAGWARRQLARLGVC